MLPEEAVEAKEVADWREKTARLPVAALRVVRAELSLRPGDVRRQLRRGLWCQADVVLVLLHSEAPESRRWVERLGVTFTTLPAAVPPWPPVPAARPGVEVDQRRFVRVGENPWRRRGRQRDDWDNFKVGRTVADYLARGGTRRWLREALASERVELQQGDGT